MTTCTTCRQDYDPTNDEAVKEHIEPVFCSRTSTRCTRCDGRPSCYFCQSSFCFCHGH